MGSHQASYDCHYTPQGEHLNTSGEKKCEAPTPPSPIGPPCKAWTDLTPYSDRSKPSDCFALPCTKALRSIKIDWPKSRSTIICASLAQASTNVNSLFTVGGTQVIKVQNGALDLRWQSNEDFNATSFAKSGSYHAAGQTATFGYLSWIYGDPAASPAAVHFYSGKGGLNRNVRNPASNVDPRDPNQYYVRASPYFKYETYTGTYFWYTSGAMTTPRYVTCIRDRLGYTLYYTYNASSQLTTIYGDLGRLVPYFGYDASGHVKQMYLQDSIANDNRATYYGYDATANPALKHIVEPEETVTYFFVDGINTEVKREQDPDNYVTYLVYDTGGTASIFRVQQVDRTTYFSSVDSSKSVSRFQSSQNKVYYYSVAAPHIVQVNDEGYGGMWTHYDYDSSRVLKGVTDPNGYQTYFGISTTNLRTRVQNPDSGTTYFSYASNGVDIQTETGPRNSYISQVTYYGYLGDTGKCSRILNPLLEVSYFNFDSKTRLSSTLDANNGATYFYYNQYNDNDVVIDALNNIAYFAFNANGRVTQQLDPLGRITYYTYDLLDQQKSVLSPTGEVTSYGRNKRGLITAIGRANGRAAYYAFDGYKNLLRQSQAAASSLVTTYYQYDVQDNTTVSVDPNGNVTYFGFDWRKKNIWTLDALSNPTYFACEAAGNLSDRLDAKGHWSHYEYDSVNRLIKLVRGTVGPHPPRMGAVKAHWTLDEASGNRADDSGNNNTLIDKNSVGSAAGMISLAANFNKANSTYFAIGDPPSLKITSDLTIAAWVKFSSYPASGKQYCICSKWGTSGSWSYRFYVQVDTPGNLRPGLDLTTNGTTLTSYLCAERIEKDSLWHQLAVVYRAATGAVDFYIDGVLVQTMTFSTITSIFNSTAYFTMGCDTSSGPTNFFDGAIDEAYVFNAALNRSEIGRLVQQRIEYTYANDDSALPTTYYNYDLSGNRSVAIDEVGSVTYYGYDAINRLHRIRDPLGNATYYGYDPNGNFLRVLNPLLNSTYFGYDLLSRQTTQLNALGQASYFGYDAVGNRIASLSPSQTSEYFAYDGSDRLITYQDRGGFSSYFGYDAVGNRTQVLDLRGNSTYFAFDLLDRRTATLDALNQPVYFEYDANGNLVWLTDHVSAAGNARTYFGYDAVNQLVKQTDALNRATYYSYDPVGNQTQIVRSGTALRVAQVGFDKFDRVGAMLSPVSAAIYFGYDAANRTVQTLNSRLNATYFGYDANSRLNQSLDALNGAGYFVYDVNGNVIRQRDVRGFWTYFAYDALDRLTQTTDSLLGITQRGYDLGSNVSAILPPAGNAAYFSYDARDLLATAADGMGDVTYFDYDGNANRVKTLSPRNYGTYFGYDALNRLAAVLDAENGNSYFGYDVGGNVRVATDALNHSTYFEYDLIDRVTKVNDALNNTVYFAYDLAGNRNVEADARLNSTYYFYDAGDRLTVIVDPLLKASYYGYDASSNLAATLDNLSNAVYFGYDALDRRTNIFYTSGSVAQYFAYDAGGNLTTTLDAWGAAYFGYDALSRAVARVTPNNDTVYYAYDASSNLVKLQYPRDNAACYYGYDGAQRITKALSPSSRNTYYTYDASSNVTQKTYGNAMASFANFDCTERMISLRYATSGNDPVVYFDFNRDVSGNINVVQCEPALGVAIYYSYDAVNRLAAEIWRKSSDNTQVYAFSYSYDAANNRLAERRESAAGTELESSYYAYDVDNSMLRRRLQVPPSSATDSYFYYDLNGARIATVEGGAATYFQYGPNRLPTVIAPPSEAATYFYYDGLQNNYLINKAGTLTYYLWDGLRLLEERNSDGTLKARYTHGYSRLPGLGTILEVQRNVGAATYYQFPAADHRGTVYAVTDANQNIQLSYTMDAFGRQLSAIGGADPNVPNDFIVQTNALTLKIGGVWYLKFRYRIERIDEGAFMSRDFLQFLNLYRLWSNNPVKQVDANGLADSDGSLKAYVDEDGKVVEALHGYTFENYLDAVAPKYEYKSGKEGGYYKATGDYGVPVENPTWWPDRDLEQSYSFLTIKNCADHIRLAKAVKVVKDALDDLLDNPNALQELQRRLASKQYYQGRTVCDAEKLLKLLQCMRDKLKGTGHIRITCLDLDKATRLRYHVPESTGTIYGLAPREFPSNDIILFNYGINLLPEKLRNEIARLPKEKGEAKRAEYLKDKKINAYLTKFAARTIAHELSHTCGTRDPGDEGFKGIPLGSAIPDLLGISVTEPK